MVKWLKSAGDAGSCARLGRVVVMGRVLIVVVLKHLDFLDIEMAGHWCR